MSAEVYLLLKTKSGKKKKDVKSVKKGELVVPIPMGKKVHTRDEPLHNFQQYTDHEITLHASLQDVAPLNGNEPLYLEAVESYSARTQMYISGTLLSVTSLKEGEAVSVQMLNGAANGIIKYIGAYQGKPGVQFGVELLDEKYKKKGTTDGRPHFSCGYKNAVYVSADKLIFVASEKPSKDRGSNNTKKTSEGVMMTRARAARRGEHSSVDLPNCGPLEKAKGTLKKLWSSEPDQVPVGKHRFNVGDRVMMHSSQNVEVHGTVRWTGTLTTSKDTKIDGPVVFAGIETDISINPEKDFPDIHAGVTGSHGQEWFGVAKSHGRVYLPEQVLEREEVSKCPTAGADEKNLVHVAGCISESSPSKKMSLEELKEQQEAMRTYEQQQAERQLNKKMRDDHENFRPEEFRQQVAGIEEFGQDRAKNQWVHVQPAEVNIHNLRPEEYEEQVQALKQFQNEKALKETKKGQVNTENIVTGNTYPHHSPSQLSESGWSAAGRPNQGGAREPDHRWPYSDPCQSKTYAQSASPHHIPPESALTHGHFSRQSSRTDSGELGINPVQAYNPNLRDLEVSSSSGEALFGTTVCLKNNPDTKGIIRWVGSLPDYPKGAIAGIELFEPLQGCTDGVHNGSRYFYCFPGKGFFIPLNSLLLLDGHIGSEARVLNPLRSVPQFEENGDIGSPELFDLYIGDGRGIQGHYNSCYLDSTVFALFALSDSFDSLLLERPTNQHGERIRDIISKSIVNPLRKHGAARHESVMELRNALESLGAMKGVNKDEKDPEEFLNMLFKDILNVSPFISIKRPFGTEKEFFIQLFFEIDKQSTEVPDSEKLLQKMFREQKISFMQIPSKLLLQMPRFGKEYKIFSRIIPAVFMDVKPMLDISVLGEQDCFICREKAAFGCRECKEKFKSDLEYVFLCSNCFHVVHAAENTQEHNYEPLPDMGSADMVNTKLELLSVVCIETSHYVCFTRTPEDRWLFHDSMANRVFDVYNIPRVIDVTDLLKEWVYDASHGQRLKDSFGKQIPEIVRRFTQDIYMCVYINPDLDMYGDGSAGDVV